jgi:hypothetical protein
MHRIAVLIAFSTILLTVMTACRARASAESLHSADGR